MGEGHGSLLSIKASSIREVPLNFQQLGEFQNDLSVSLSQVGDAGSPPILVERWRSVVAREPVVAQPVDPGVGQTKVLPGEVRDRG